MKSQQRQRGAFLVLAAILMAVLLGISALAIDVGRIYSTRTEMQNAVDAAALAAAVELNASAGSRDRARAAARNLLLHDSRFAQVAALLGDAGLPDEAFTFYCHIGSQFDPTTNIDSYCGNLTDGEGRYLATSDARSKYVRIYLDPDLAGVPAGRYRLDLMFLPILGALGINTAQAAEIAAQALAGRSFYTCNTAPIGICDPWENDGNPATHFSNSMPLGGSIKLRSGGPTQWTAGNFGFLRAPNASGASDLAGFLAADDGQGCSPPEVSTETGSMTQQTTWGVNTRFDQYSGPFNNDWDDYPPAPNIVNFPHDTSYLGIDPGQRFRAPNWDFNSYWSNAHGGLPAPNGWSNLSLPMRKSVYEWEISNNQIPNTASHDGTPNPAHVGPGSIAGRRIIKVAVMSCATMGINGGQDSGIISEPDGYANIFLYTEATAPSGTVVNPDPDSGADQPAVYGEYISWSAVTDGQYNIDVVLYD